MGRRERSQLESVRTTAWFWAVAQTSGCQAPAEIADYLGDRSGCDDERQWRRYRNGAVSPSAATLNAVEQRLNGSRDVYEGGPERSGLWFALDPETSGQERYRLIQRQWDEWSRMSNIPVELQRWLEYWPPRHRFVHEICDELPPILLGLGALYPLHALATAYHLWHTVASGLMVAIPTPDVLPAVSLVASLFPVAEERLLSYGVSTGDLLAVADPLDGVGTARALLPPQAGSRDDFQPSVTYGPSLGSWSCHSDTSEEN